MKTFSELREKKTQGEVVYDKKINRISTKVLKDRKGYTAYIDGDKLDTFRSENDAKKAITMAIKELT